MHLKIKEISERYANAHYPVPVGALMQELRSNHDVIMQLLDELIHLRMIKYNERTKQSVTLTLYGLHINK